jgi:hypothetical protein
MEDKPHFDPQGYTEHEIWVENTETGETGLYCTVRHNSWSRLSKIVGALNSYDFERRGNNMKVKYWIKENYILHKAGTML